MPRRWFQWAVINFFIAACIGLLLRYAFVSELPWLHYRFLMHAHSHVAMLGWVYLGLFALLIHYFLPVELHQHPFYQKLFWGQQICVTGMLICFPLLGYTSWSIVFTSLHLLLSYLFVWRFIRDLRSSPVAGSLSKRFVITALVWMVVATLALWALVPIMLLKMQQSALYYACVQFYLHFQFNGWFIWAALALAFRLMGQKKIKVDLRSLYYFYYFLAASCLLTYVLAVTWSTPIRLLFWINSFGVSLQLVALYFFLKAILPAYRQLKSTLDSWANRLLYIAFLSFVLKVLIQSAVIIPYLATVAYTIRNYVLGFLHLILLGIMSCALFALAGQQGWLPHRQKFKRLGLGLFLAGFVLTELLLFEQGSLFWAALGFIPYYYEGLFGISVLMPLGLLFVIYGWWAERVR